MKLVSTAWLAGLVIFLGAALPSLAVDGDGQAPCWRGQAGTTRQMWRFDTAATNAAPEVVNNGAGSPEARVVTNYLSAGWFNTNGAVYGTAQGFWDLGGSNQLVSSAGSLLLTVPNAVSAGGTRYLWVQATVFVESGFFGHPALLISNATQIGSASTQLAEGITYDPDFGIWFGWYTRQTLWAVSDTTSSNNLVLRAATVGSLVDTVVVDTMDRSPAVDDTASTPRNVALNLSTTTLLANDGGPTLNVVGVSSPSTAGGTVSLGSGTVTYTPPTDYTGQDMFYYTNSDCVGGTAVAEVMVDVTSNSLVVVQLEPGVPGPDTNRLTLVGIPNYEYVVQFATNVEGPWFGFSTNTAGANGLWTVLDSTATNTSRYYRITTP